MRKCIFGMQNVECKLWSAKCGMQSVELMTLAKEQANDEVRDGSNANKHWGTECHSVKHELACLLVAKRRHDVAPDFSPRCKTSHERKS